MTENQFLLNDRCQKIRQIYKEYDLENTAYLSFSGGKDSTLLSALLDFACPGNKIPRVFCNTGLEYKKLVEFVREKAKTDKRFIEIHPTCNIKQMLEEEGYPFKSKEYAHKLKLLKDGSNSQNMKKYFRIIPGADRRFACPQILQYQATTDIGFKISDLCCQRLKKDPCNLWAKQNGKTTAILGIRTAEGGQRKNLKNCLAFKGTALKHFSPLLPCSDNFVNWLSTELNVIYCKLYYEPYKYTRTGCKGCPFSITVQQELEKMERYFPAERKQCEIIFGKVYDEYRRIGYRIKNKQKKEGEK